jgi:hypothetical protein
LVDHNIMCRYLAAQCQVCLFHHHELELIVPGSAR